MRNTTLDRDVTIKGTWEYEEGYNPFDEAVAAILEDETYWDTAITKFMFSTNINTAMTGMIAERVNVDYFDRPYKVATITDYTGSAPVVIIPDNLAGIPVTAVNGAKFSNKKDVQGLVLPATVQIISGFQEFPNLQYVYFMDEPKTFRLSAEVQKTFTGISLIEKNCFSGCANLANVVIPSSIQYLGEQAFAFSGLEEISFEFDSQFTIGDDVFFNCKRLYSAHLPKNLSILPDRTFYGCSALRDIDLSPFTSFGNECLRDTAIEAFKARGVTYMGEYVLGDMPNLTEVDLSMAPSYGFNLSSGTFHVFNCPKLKKVRMLNPIQFSSSSCPALEEIEIVPLGDNLSLNDLDECTMLRSVVIGGNADKVYLSDNEALERLRIDGSVKTLSLYCQPRLREVSVLGEIAELYIAQAPSLATLRFGALTCGSEDHAVLSLEDCPVLRDIDGVIGEKVTARFLDMPLSALDLTGYQSVTELKNLSDLRALDLSMLGDNDDYIIQIDNLPRLSRLTLSSDGAMRYSIQRCPKLQAVIAPAALDQVDLCEIGQDGGICRVILEDAKTQVSVDDDELYDRLYVVVAPQASPAWRTLADVPEVCLLTPSEAAQGIHMLAARCVYGVTIIDEGTSATAANDEVLWLRRHVGDPLNLPAVHGDEPGVILQGWYEGSGSRSLESPLSVDRMPARDMQIHPKRDWMDVESDFDFAFNADGTARVMRYLGNDAVVPVPGQIAGYRVTDIDDAAFDSPDIVRLDLPDSLTDFRPRTFSALSALNSLEICNALYGNLDGAVLAKDENGDFTTLLFCPRGMTGALTLPETVTAVASDAIHNCEGR